MHIHDVVKKLCMENPHPHTGTHCYVMVRKTATSKESNSKHLGAFIISTFIQHLHLQDLGLFFPSQHSTFTCSTRRLWIWKCNFLRIANSTYYTHKQIKTNLFNNLRKTQSRSWINLGKFYCAKILCFQIFFNYSYKLPWNIPEKRS
jgi:hypothetical protein